MNSTPNSSLIASSNVNVLNATADEIDNENPQTGGNVGSDLQVIVSLLNSMYPETRAELKGFSFPSENVKTIGMRSLLNFMSLDIAFSREEVMFFHSVLINGPERAIEQVTKPLVLCLRPLLTLLEGLQSSETR